MVFCCTHRYVPSLVVITASSVSRRENVQSPCDRNYVEKDSKMDLSIRSLPLRSWKLGEAEEERL